MAASTLKASAQKVGENSGKSAFIQPPTQPPLNCPECTSQHVWKDGFRYVKTETGQLPIQRYLCRDCGRRFSEEAKESYITCHHSQGRQVCVSKQEMKNLSRQRTRVEKRAAGATIDLRCREDLKGKLVEYLWYLKKQGYAESTVKQETDILERLHRYGANLLDPESVKLYLATRSDWSLGYKQNIVACYHNFVKMQGLSWTPPHYRPVERLPFIPLEKEIDILISGCGIKVATSLQLLKETGMRIGEAWMLEWTNIDMEHNTITCQPEKHGKPRMFKITPKLVAMLKRLSRNNQHVFGNTNINTHRANYNRQRKRLAQKLSNPRLNKITFHTLRHWKATIEYHKTKDILHVQQLLGHRKIESTIKYTHLVTFDNPEEFTCRIATNLVQAKELVEAGFEYVTDMNQKKLFRKRK